MGQTGSRVQKGQLRAQNKGSLELGPGAPLRLLSGLFFYQAQAMPVSAFALFQGTSCLENDWGWELTAELTVTVGLCLNAEQMDRLLGLGGSLGILYK